MHALLLTNGRRDRLRCRDLPGSFAKVFVALTCRRLHHLSIQYLYVTTTIINHRRGFELVCDVRHGSSPNSKHLGKKLLRQSDVVTIDPVRSLQDPSAEPGLQAMKHVTGGSYSRLGKQCLIVPNTEVAYRPAIVGEEGESRRAYSCANQRQLNSGADV